MKAHLLKKYWHAFEVLIQYSGYKIALKYAMSQSSDPEVHNHIPCFKLSAGIGFY